MAKIGITKTELGWPGKYNEDGTRKKEGDTFDAGWTNRLANKLLNRLAQVDRLICCRRRLGNVLYLGCSTSVC